MVFTCQLATVIAQTIQNVLIVSNGTRARPKIIWMYMSTSSWQRNSTFKIVPFTAVILHCRVLLPEDCLDNMLTQKTSSNTTPSNCLPPISFHFGHPRAVSCLWDEPISGASLEFYIFCNPLSMLCSRVYILMTINIIYENEVEQNRPLSPGLRSWSGERSPGSFSQVTENAGLVVI